MKSNNQTGETARQEMGEVFAEVEEALDEIRRGRMLIVTDDEGRENEGDIIMAAEKVTVDALNFIASHARGLLCQALTPERAATLDLPMMVQKNTAVHATGFTVSVDAREKTTTGISTYDREATIKTLIDPATRPDDLCRPGHIFPLIARRGGVLVRDGHTETAVDLARLAGLYPSGILCEILDDDGKMARLPRLARMAREYGLKILTVKKLIEWRKAHDTIEESEDAVSVAPPKRLAQSRLPSCSGNFQLISYDNPGYPNQPHLAIVSEKPYKAGNALVRIHSECLTGEVLGSLRCDCSAQLSAALERVGQEGGVLVYLRQEGRGIGLTEKIRAYALQDEGLDTIDANLKLGHQADQRDYAVAAAILKDLGVSGIRLMTNNPDKSQALQQAGITINEMVHIEIEPGDENRSYLATKKNRFRHTLELV
ncbi:MAG: 3,4-dihydroxy-2-butanone-4-phosphate synthase [Treponema sp.]|nr:3,4-dihydroxy-2-butanone-4-phosphate synthase [Treponema sp.]